MWIEIGIGASRRVQPVAWAGLAGLTVDECILARCVRYTRLILCNTLPRIPTKKRHAQMPSATSATLAAHAHQAERETPNPLRCAYVTFLLTSPSYLPGILLLAHTLRHPTTSPRDSSAYPLIVAVNPALPADCIRALEHAGVQVRKVEPLVPSGRVTIIAERFVDTWTKLRVWEFGEFDVSAEERAEERSDDGENQAERSENTLEPRSEATTARIPSPRAKRAYQRRRQGHPRPS